MRWLEDYGTQHRLDRPLGYALAMRLRWQLRRGETVQAQGTLERIVLLGARQAGRTSTAAAEVRRIAERARAEMSLNWNDFDAAIARLGPVMTECEACGRYRTVVLLQAQLACAEAGRGNAETARRHPLEALRLGHRLGLSRSLLDADRRVPEQIGALLRDAPVDPVLAFYARRVLAAANATRPWHACATSSWAGITPPFAAATTSHPNQAALCIVAKGCWWPTALATCHCCCASSRQRRSKRRVTCRTNGLRRCAA
ncbi:hypothetical protein [Variovorax sp. dw_308]|uniref:hypothetical protein n=1 Tax=Variovorax sp. dw_308 TaxID=2721546 RepID=UPI001C473A77|nr:hypothetical protein [Variovorax sp. dw_308]